MTHPGLRWAPVIVALFVLGACSSEGSSGGPAPTSTTSPAPAAGIDPNARGVLTGPINKARRTAEELEQHQREQDQQSGSEPSQ